MVVSEWRLISCYFHLLLYCTVLLADRINGRAYLYLLIVQDCMFVKKTAAILWAVY